jgi:hypothetical protein
MNKIKNNKKKKKRKPNGEVIALYFKVLSSPKIEYSGPVKILFPSLKAVATN